MRKKKHVDSIPEVFASYEEAAEFWDIHDTTDYPDAFHDVKLSTEFRGRRSEVGLEEDSPQARGRKASTMGTFYTRCKVENITDRTRSAVVSKLLVDTGSDYTWIPGTTVEKLDIAREKKDEPFVMANGQQVTRSVGFALIRLDKFFTVDEVVFAEKGDLAILGARTLEGLNLSVDSKRKRLVASGPHLAAARVIDFNE